MKPRAITRRAFRTARRYLQRTPGRCTLDGYCIEASVLMHKYLSRRGVRAKLVRYATPVGGHWTIRTPEGEFDPTIGCWSDRPPSAKCGALYAVTAKSPHRRWRKTRTNKRAAYSAVWCADFDTKSSSF